MPLEPRSRPLVALIASFATLVAGCAQDSAMGGVKLTQKDAYTLVPDKNPVTEFPAINSDGSINVVVEIPAGTSEKWEMRATDGTLMHEFTGNKPRVVKYLPYPGNYGLIPRTLLDTAGGGDAEPLDVMVLGPAVPRGSVVQAQPLGVIKLLDRGEQDDKILAVMKDSPLATAVDVEDLERKFPGTTLILRTWFQNYSGAGSMLFLGVSSRVVANNTVKMAADSFESAR